SETISVVVKQSDPQLLGALQHIPGVLQVTQGSSPQSFVLETQMGRDIREDLTRVIVSRNAGLLELKVQPLTLEEVFKVLTRPSHSGEFTKAEPVEGQPLQNKYSL